MAWLLFVSVAFLLLVIASIWYAATFILPLYILQPGHRRGMQTPADYGLDYEHLRLPVAEDIELDAHFVPATIAAKANLIILHGVGSCKETYLPEAPRLCAMGYNLFLVDQRQHGRSGGKYLTYGHHEKHDVSRMLDWLDERTGGLRTGVYGNSMGAAVALQALAHDERLAFGLIESTFTDLPAVTRAYTRLMLGFSPPVWFTDYVLRRAGALAGFDPWAIRPLDAAARIEQPLQFIHGDADRRINVAHGRALFAAATTADKQLYVVPGGDHADLWDVGDEGYPTAWFGFLERMVTEEA